MGSDLKPTYSHEEVTEILRRSLEQQGERGERALTHEELVEMAAEIGIDRDALDAATATLAQEHALELARRHEAKDLAVERGIQARRFAQSVMSLGIVDVAAYLADAHAGGLEWFFWPLLGSGVIWAWQLKNVIFPHDKLERRKRRELRLAEKERRRAERERWKQEVLQRGSAIADGAREFERAVSAGVTALLRAATRKLEEHTKEPPRR